MVFSQKQIVFSDTIDNVNFRQSHLKSANFYRVLFNGYSTFSNAQFTSQADFSYSEFDSSAEFSEAEFDSLVKFSGVKFNSYANFPFAKFKEVFFLGTQFKLLANFTNAQFTSHANFSEAQLINARFINAQFETNAIFSDADFYSSTVFSTQFKSPVFFKNAKFYSAVKFSKDLLSPPDFKIGFKSLADFSGAKFVSQADFSKVEFDSLADFSKVEFDSLADFSGANFDALVKFSEVKFVSQANFSGAKFDSMVDFSEAEFDSIANFSGSKFKSIISFSGVKWNDKAIFRDMTLPSIMNFDDIKKITNEIDFTFCNLDTGQQVCKINLVDTDISKIKLRYSRFALEFPLSVEYEKKSNVYEQLLAMQKKHGFSESFEKLDKEYRSFKYTTKKDSSDIIVLGHVYNFAQKNWWGYGYDKEKVVWNTFILLFIFSLINYRFFQLMNERVYKIDNVWDAYEKRKKTLQKKITVISGISFYPNKLVYTFYYTSLIFFGLKLSIEKINYSHPGGVAYLLFQYTVGLICLAYIANFIILS